MIPTRRLSGRVTLNVPRLGHPPTEWPNWCNVGLFFRDLQDAQLTLLALLLQLGQPLPMIELRHRLSMGSDKAALNMVSW